MSHATLSPNARLTDTLERDVVRSAMARQSSLNAGGLLARAARGTLRGLVATVAFFDEVNAEMERARKVHGLRSGSDW
ncbi:hypothetical protein V8Z80_07475 [Orrella sp. JC864]|uniref:hypothetical protein n=1 Tax=Orrella sp. JC864 TaxID=3120298 RepID=UPI003008BEAF